MRKNVAIAEKGVVIQGFFEMVRWLNMALKIIGGVFLVFMAVTVFGSVISRFVASLSISWIEESSTFCMSWVAVIGTALAVRGGDLTALDLVVIRLPKRGQFFIKMLVVVCD